MNKAVLVSKSFNPVIEDHYARGPHPFTSLSLPYQIYNKYGKLA